MQAEALQMDIIVHRVFPIGGGLRLVSPVSPPRRAARLRVLLVEDDEADVYLIRRALANNPRVGEVVVARDGVEALELIEYWSTAPDLAIVDLHMPRRDGFALLRDFASRKTDPFPSIVLTSSRAGADALRSKKRGAVEFLTKPNSVEKLTTALDRVIAMI
jgi:two-component system response regulator